MHISRGGGAPREGEMGGKNGVILARESPESTRKSPFLTPNSPLLTQIGPGMARKSPGSARVWSGGMWGGVFVRGRCWGMSCWSEEKFWAVEFLLHAGGLFHLGRFFRFPPPYPLPRLCFLKGGPRWRGRGRLFDISHFKGGVPPLHPLRGRALPRTPSYEAGLRPPRTPASGGK